MGEHYDSEPPDRHEEERIEEEPGYARGERVTHDVAAERRSQLVRITQLVWLIFGLIDALIAIRIFLKLIAANPNSGFAIFVYGITAPFVAPFVGLTITPSADGVVFEISSLIAIVVYALIGWIIVKLMWVLLYREPTRRVSTYERETHLPPPHPR